MRPTPGARLSERLKRERPARVAEMVELNRQCAGLNAIAASVLINKHMADQARYRARLLWEYRR